MLGNPATRVAANSAFQDAILLIGVLGLIGGAVTLLIRDRDAAATMAPRTALVEGDAGEAVRARPV